MKKPMELVKKPKRNQPKVDFYSSQETQELLKAVKGTKLEIVVTLTVAYGLRRSEVLGLRWQDVDFDMGRIAVCHTVVEGVEDGKRVICKKDTMKEEASYRTLPLFEPITEMLRDELKRKHPYNPIYVCSDRYGRMMKPDVLTHDFKLFLEKSGLRHIRYHDLRHTTASLLIAEHVPLIEVQHWLGHKTMLTTANLYSHLDTSLIDECGNTVKKFLILNGP